MNALKTWLLNLVGLVHSIKDENLHWRQQNQAQQLDLKQVQALAEQALAAELKKKNVQLQHDIALLNTKNQAELTMLKTKCKQDVQDYKQYLQALDQLKRSIQNSYPHLSQAVSFTIHHHAKHLLNQMWEAEDFAEKMRHEMQLITFMSTVHEDAQLFLQGQSQQTLPEKTLSLINGVRLN
ncbi:MAG: hypothetical protein ABL925_10905 [Methylococcales bacterium]